VSLTVPGVSEEAVGVMPQIHLPAGLPNAHEIMRRVGQRLTDNSKREPVSKGSHLIICASAIDLKDGHSYELCQESRP